MSLWAHFEKIVPTQDHFNVLLGLQFLIGVMFDYQYNDDESPPNHVFIRQAKKKLISPITSLARHLEANTFSNPEEPKEPKPGLVEMTPEQYENWQQFEKIVQTDHHLGFLKTLPIDSMVRYPYVKGQPEPDAKYIRLAERKLVSAIHSVASKLEVEWRVAHQR